MPYFSKATSFPLERDKVVCYILVKCGGGCGDDRNPINLMALTLGFQGKSNIPSVICYLYMFYFIVKFMVCRNMA